MADENKERHEQRKLIVEIWKVAIEVQQHFNDISMRIRSMFITILLALFASVGFLLDKKLNLEISVVNIQYAVLVPLFGILGAYLFYFIDRYWYHRLLVGAVKHAIAIEQKYKSEMPELSLSEAIGAESPYKPRGAARWLARWLVSDERYHTTGQLHSDGKIEFFYKSVELALLVTAVIIAVLGGVTFDRKASAIPSSSITTPAPTPAPNSSPPAPQIPPPQAPAAPPSTKALPPPGPDRP